MIPTAESPDVFGNTVFCDDIREEVGGKVSLIGAYMGGMNVHSPFPATVVKFAFAISLWQRHTRYRRNISFRVYLPGDEDETPSIESQLEAPPIPEEATHTPFVVIRANLSLTGMVIKEAGPIRVRAFMDGVLYPIGSLMVTQAPTSEVPPAPAAA